MENFFKTILNFFLLIGGIILWVGVEFLSRRQFGAVVDAAMAVIVKGEVEPLLVCADEAVGIVHAAFRTIARFGLQHALIGPGLHAVKTDPQGHWTAMLRIGIVQQCNRVASQAVESRLRAGIGNRRFRREVRPSATTIIRFRIIEHSAQPVGTDYHRDALISQFDETVFSPAVIPVVVGDADVAVLGECLSTITTDEHSVAGITDVVE